MSKKPANKAKSKTTSYPELLHSGKKCAPKIFNPGKTYGSHKGLIGGAKGKLKYGIHSPSALELHEAGQGLADVAEMTAVNTEATPVEQETDLAGRLVDDIAAESEDVQKLCATYGLKREELGRLTGFSLRALAEWASGQLPSQPARRRLKEVKRLLDALAEIVKPAQIPQWLHRRNPAFAPLTPLQVIELGEIDRLWSMVHDLGSGQSD